MSGMMAMMANNVQRARRPVFDLDAANFTAMPVNGTIVNGFPLTVVNSGGTIVRSNNNGGTFVQTYNYPYDYISGGPNYETGKSYTVFLAYKLILGTSDSFGRLLTTANWPGTNGNWIMGSYNSRPKTFYPNISVSLSLYDLDDIWHLDFATWNTSTYTGTLYATTNTAPVNYTHQLVSTNGGGFNGLRLFSFPNDTYPHRGHIAFVKVYDGVLTLPEMQSLHTTHKARFGY